MTDHDHPDLRPSHRPFTRDDWDVLRQVVEHIQADADLVNFSAALVDALERYSVKEPPQDDMLRRLREAAKIVARGVRLPGDATW